MTQAIRPGGPEAAWQRDTGLPETLKGSSTAFAMENSQLSSEQSRQLLQDKSKTVFLKERMEALQFKTPF